MPHGEVLCIKLQFSKISFKRLVYILYTLIFEILSSLDSVVGYHISFTRRRPSVRVRVETFFILRQKKSFEMTAVELLDGLISYSKKDTGFPIENLPFGVCSVNNDNATRVIHSMRDLSFDFKSL